MCLAVPGQLLDFDGAEPLLRRGRVNFAGIVKSVQLAFVPEAKVGDFLLVHAGVAIAIVDQAEAARTLAYLDQLETEEPA